MLHEAPINDQERLPVRSAGLDRGMRTCRVVELKGLADHRAQSAFSGHREGGARQLAHLIRRDLGAAHDLDVAPCRLLVADRRERSAREAEGIEAPAIAYQVKGL